MCRELRVISYKIMSREYHIILCLTPLHLLSRMYIFNVLIKGFFLDLQFQNIQFKNTILKITRL